MDVSSSFRRLFDRQQSGSAVVLSYAPHVFQAIRLLDGIGTEAFIRSFDEEQILIHLSSQKFSEGRSGSFFIFTPDRRFIIKTVPLNEAMLLIRVLRPYYMVRSLGPPGPRVCGLMGRFFVVGGVAFEETSQFVVVSILWSVSVPVGILSGCVCDCDEQHLLYLTSDPSAL